MMTSQTTLGDFRDHQLRTTAFEDDSIFTQEINNETPVEMFNGDDENSAVNFDANVNIKCEVLDDSYGRAELQIEQTHKKPASQPRHRKKKKTSQPTRKDPIICQKCKTTFKKIANLNRHMKSVHAVNEQSPCRICFKVFRSKIHLENHERKVHSELFEPIQTCEHCNKDFKSKGYLRRHITEVHPENPGLVECKECTKRFKSSHHLKIHKQRMHPPEGKKVPCNICGKVFSCQLYMIKHCETSHLVTVSPHICTMCTIPFNSMAKLNKHLKHAHCPEGKVKCDECNKFYVDDVKLRKHKYRAHNKRDPAVCPICNRQYKTREVLTNHLKVVHGPKHCCKLCGNCFDNEMFMFLHIQSEHFNECINNLDLMYKAMDMVLPPLQHLLNTSIDGLGRPKTVNRRFSKFKLVGMSNDKVANVQGIRPQSSRE